MTAQTIVLSNNINHNVIDEFFSDYSYAQSEIEGLLLSLENNPTDTDLLNGLFRKVHNIKGNSHFLGLHVMTDFVHSLETVLDKLRNREISYTRTIGDVVLKAVDQIGSFITNARDNQHLNMNLINSIRGDLKNMVAETCNYPEKKHSGNFYVEALNMSDFRTEAADLGTEQKQKDLQLFASLSENAEQRSLSWHGRSRAILKIAEEINRESGYSVDPLQLEAAIYLHDLGMAFLPSNDENFETLSLENQTSLRMHPNMGASLIANNPNWVEAARIIQEHHEREDGTGYPMGLKGSQICDGAKILAIAETIETIVNRRDGNNSKYPVSAAIREINKNEGSQFSSEWVAIFNRIIRGSNKTN